MRRQLLVLVGRDLEFELVFFFAPDSEIALDPALSIQHQAVYARVGRQILHAVRNHPVQPAEAISAANAYPAHPTKIMGYRCLGESRYFVAGRVKLLWGKDAAKL